MDLDEYLSFFYFLSKFQENKRKIYNGKHSIDIEALQNLYEKFVSEMDRKYKPKINYKMLLLFFQILDEDNSGTLEFTEIDEVIMKRNYFGAAKNDVFT